MSDKCPGCGGFLAWDRYAQRWLCSACGKEWTPAELALAELGTLRRQLAQRDDQLAEKETEIAALGQELADLKETEKELWDQCITDQICFYRNLAIRYGAKPEDMDNEWDTGLAEDARAKDTKLAALKAIMERLRLAADKMVRAFPEEASGQEFNIPYQVRQELREAAEQARKENPDRSETVGGNATPGVG